MGYMNLHTHTEYSNITTGLDSINKLEDVVAYAREMGLSGLAITNHDNLCEIVNINRLQKKLRKEFENASADTSIVSAPSFTLAFGNEIYLVDEFEDNDAKDTRRIYYHFILVALDRIGFQAIIELSTRAWYRSCIQRGRRRVPTLKSDIEELAPLFKGHVVATSACLGGELPKLIAAEEYEKAAEFVNWCIDQFGEGNFFIELQPSNIADQIKFNKFWKWKPNEENERFWSNIRAKDAIQITVATDAHYQAPEDFPMLEAFLRSHQEKREVQEFYEYARIQSEDEVRQLLDYMPKEMIDKALENTELIRQRIEFFDLDQKPHIPIVPVKPPRSGIYEIDECDYPALFHALHDDYDDLQTQYCIKTCLNQLIERGLWYPEYLERLNEEFDVFKFQSAELNQNFFAYFNTMQHYLDLMWNNDCAVGPSRGSASGSLLCYLMDIVQCDPIQHGLYFWRFANKVRASILDIDIDMQPSRRSQVFYKVRQERGELGLTQVATYRTLTLKAAIGNASRGYRSKEFPNGLDSDISTYISSLIEIKRGFVATLKQTLYGDEVTGYSVNHNFIKECKAYPGLLEMICKFEGLVAGSGTHAAAVILFDEQDRLTQHCSLMRAPNGDMCTALDLHTVEEVGCIKYDWLLLSTLDVQSTCFKLLQQYGVVDSSLTLKQCYRQYLDPNKVDFADSRIWDNLYSNEVLSIFQFDAASGRKGILAARPENLDEMTAINGLIRLMTAPGEEDQIERFVKFKEQPELFEYEMQANGLSEEQRQLMHQELDRYNGCAVTQESFMILSQLLAGYTLADADKLRKVVAKKKMNEITAQKEFFFSKMIGKECPLPVAEYLWKVIIQPSLGYGFSLNHAKPYSIIGVQCVLLGGVLFPAIYWQTACLLQRSGALDDKNADYNKIAKAVSAIVRQNVQIYPVDINVSQREFTMDVENGAIYFGLAGVKGLRTATLEKIEQLRPFNSMFDFIARSGADITSIVTLVKCGAFDRFSASREECIEALARFKADTKTKLNGQNLLMLSREGHWPQDTEELRFSQRVFNFTQYLKGLANRDVLETAYPLDDRAIEFLDEIGYPHNGVEMEKTIWKTYYDLRMKPIKAYLVEHQEEMLERVNRQVLDTWKEKYFPKGDMALGEIETMGLNFAPHPLINVRTGMTDFNTLSTEPEMASTFVKDGRNIPIWKLHMICGAAIAKDKLHHSITLLTTTGPVEVKFRKEEFAHYDAQISKVVDGHKQVIEKSWFNRGNMLIVHGMRQDDQFIAKKYKRSPMTHTCYKILSVDGTGFCQVQKDRKKGQEEDSGIE